MKKITASLLSALVVISSGPTGAAGEESFNVANNALNEKAVNCIQNNSPWSDCYNMQLGDNDKKVDPGFSGFHADVFGNSSEGIESIWIPTPAELFSEPRGIRN